ncbi:MAG: type II toxin-antitoxin system Phd/YefM family antitoxin [Microthrixaceae bacterium]|jgi:prevent-host-death family protein
MVVGIRELKAKLSEYLVRAQAGEEVVVTDRGRPVARIVPLADDAAVERGIAEGWVAAPRRRGRLGEVERVRSQMSVLDAIDEDRG